MGDVVTFFMKSTSLETIFRCPKYKFKFFGIVKRLIDKLDVIDVPFSNDHRCEVVFLKLTLSNCNISFLLLSHDF